MVTLDTKDGYDWELENFEEYLENKEEFSEELTREQYDALDNGKTLKEMRNEPKTVANPTVANPTVANPTVANPTVANPTVANPTVVLDSTFLVLLTNGSEIVIYTPGFCKERGLSSSNMSRLLRGKVKQHWGWTVLPSGYRLVLER